MDRTGQRTWIFLAGISIASTLGLAAAVLPLLESRIESPWPWAHTQRVLLLAFPLTVVAAIIYLADQQRRSARIQRELLRTRDRAAERMERNVARLRALLNVSRIIGSETSIQGVFDSVAKICLETFACQRVSLMLVEKDTQDLVVRAASGETDSGSLVGVRQKIGEGVAGRVAATSEALVLGPDVDAARFSGNRGPDARLAAAMVVPIKVRDELVGVINVGSTSPDVRYDNEDLQALQVFAENVGACIRHAEQAEWMRQLIRRHQTAAQPATAVAE
jgi:transcriptional regulator with GAF, ATPase, and Fis domain